jgi:Na+:H+ antiporter, NhaA family
LSSGFLVPVRHTHAIERRLNPFTAFVVLPVFAFANAGVGLDDAGASPVTIGVIVGLVAGKTLGITGAAWAAARLGLGRLPAGVTWRQIAGAGLVAGVGFTVSLFVADLAFTDPDTIVEAKVGVLAGSTLAAAAGAAWLARS